MPDETPGDDSPFSNQRVHALVALATFRIAAAMGDAEFDVSLLVSGSWITGTLINLRKYIDGLTTAIEEGDSPEFARGWSAAMEPRVAQLLDEKFHDDLAVYLRDAKVWLPDGAVVERALIAIRSDAVSAFVLGRSSRASS